MVDFKRRLAKHSVDRPIDPVQIYDRLDRASDKGPLRPAQRSILEAWHASHRTRRDVILKLHTGQGKTLLGLLMLQSYLHEAEKPALYVCPNELLVQQTLEQARQFGISCVEKPQHGLPPEFEEGRSILVVNVQTLFNGKTRFGLGASALPVNAVCLDDAHACVDRIRESTVISLDSDHKVYVALRNLFQSDLAGQGTGTFADIQRREFTAFLPVPYWAWRERHNEVAAILSASSGDKEIAFAWPLLKDMLDNCLCVISGKQLQVAPYQPPLHLFGSFDKAPHRIFMSATGADDSFLVRGLGVPEEAVKGPLTYDKERWSGEKMVLLPSLIDEQLSDEEIVHEYAKTVPGRKYGVVILCPTFNHAERWKTEGARVASRDDIEELVDALRDGDRDATIVVANRYDGIDLPDDSCRVLILDSLPTGESLLDRYIESVRETSDIVAQRIGRSIEQGLGRAVRGEKDYCAILLIGPDLVRAVRTKDGRQFLSPQTRLQIEIGLEIARAAREDIADGVPPMKSLRTLVAQCLDRDEGWKEYYVEQMEAGGNFTEAPKNLGIYSAERKAEEAFRNGDFDSAASIIQTAIDKHVTNKADKGWYLQEIARYLHPASKLESNQKQIAAHGLNPFLLKPVSGMQPRKVTVTAQKRTENIINWVRDRGSYESVMIAIDDILSHLKFGVRADRFERALNDLGVALGFSAQRPDKELKAGPDNLWALRDGEYLLLECKSEVGLTRAEVYKEETGQMNNSCAWFRDEYPGAKMKPMLVIPSKKLGKGAGFVDENVAIMRDKHLRQLVNRTRAFFTEFRMLDLKDLSVAKVQLLLEAHQLTVDDLLSDRYSESPVTIA